MKPLTTTFCWRCTGLLLCLLTVGCLLPGRAQPTAATSGPISNIRLSAVGQTSLEIVYDLAGSQPGDSVFFEVTGRKSGLMVYNPGFVEGDFGRHVAAGLNRRIVWNVLANGYDLNEEIRVRVLIKPGSPVAATTDSTRLQRLMAGTLRPDTASLVRVPRTYRPGGPLMALLSVAVPGLGNVFVQSPRPRVGFRPLLTVAVVGAIAYGLNQRSQAEGQYQLYRQQKNPAQGEPYYQQANQQQHRYYLATRAAAVLWLGDIAATFIRGLRNRTDRPESPIRVRPGYQGTTPVARLSLHF